MNAKAFTTPNQQPYPEVYELLQVEEIILEKRLAKIHASSTTPACANARNIINQLSSDLLERLDQLQALNSDLYHAQHTPHCQVQQVIQELVKI